MCAARSACALAYKHTCNPHTLGHTRAFTHQRAPCTALLHCPLHCTPAPPSPAVHDPRTPLLSKVLPWLVLAYALSPLDLIPDFIPVLGLLDDMLLLPLGLWASYKLIPKEVSMVLG